MPCGCQPNTYFFVGSNGGVVRIKRAGKYACDSAQIGCVRSASHGLPSLNSLPSRNGVGTGRSRRRTRRARASRAFRTRIRRSTRTDRRICSERARTPRRAARRPSLFPIEESDDWVQRNDTSHAPVFSSTFTRRRFSASSAFSRGIVRGSGATDRSGAVDAPCAEHRVLCRSKTGTPPPSRIGWDCSTVDLSSPLSLFLPYLDPVINGKHTKVTDCLYVSLREKGQERE